SYRRHSASSLVWSSAARPGGLVRLFGERPSWLLILFGSGRITDSFGGFKRFCPGSPALEIFWMRVGPWPYPVPTTSAGCSCLRAVRVAVRHPRVDSPEGG